MNERKPLAGGDIGKVDPASVQIFTFDAHGLIPCGNPRPRHPMPRRLAIRSIAAVRADRRAELRGGCPAESADRRAVSPRRWREAWLSLGLESGSAEL